MKDEQEDRGGNLLERAGLKLQMHPEHAPGCYVMYFYCKYANPAHPFQSRNPGTYMVEADQVETRTAAIRQIRESGWIYHSDGTCTCDLCRAAIVKARTQ